MAWRLALGLACSLDQMPRTLHVARCGLRLTDTEAECKFSVQGNVGSGHNTVRLAVRAELVEAHSPFDRLRANELKRTALGPKMRDYELARVCRRQREIAIQTRVSSLYGGEKVGDLKVAEQPYVSVSELCRKHSLSPSVSYRWHRYAFRA